MTDLRKAAEMALEALIGAEIHDPEAVQDAIQTLRQALAQPKPIKESFNPPTDVKEAFNLDRGCWGRGGMAYDWRGGDGIGVVKREWVGLTVNEARKFYEKYTNREELIYAIDKFLEEKSGG